jgi:hypothetical protein
VSAVSIKTHKYDHSKRPTFKISLTNALSFLTTGAELLRYVFMYTYLYWYTVLTIIKHAGFS